MSNKKSNYQKETGLESLPMRAKKANAERARQYREYGSSNQTASFCDLGMFNVIVEDAKYVEKGK